MVRFVAKGGIWKNTEDEMLKAAVMKYGKNQWARISSLLVRKTAKQCKARWYEWLDPSIRKTEWTRDEEEKLLHLAKLMPTQWRTIAPLVGRTATQCLEHYNRLLDAAQAREAGIDVDGAGGVAGTPQDPRRLRPGEVDPLPEAKPARPDAIDMDEDEKEMLSEARARLANTRGKKAKRKAREKALKEARRLAQIQKRRELKAAGINLHHHEPTDVMDYNREIPFYRKAPEGFFEVPESEKQAPEPFVLSHTRPDQLDAPRRDVKAQHDRRVAEAIEHEREERDLPAVVAQRNKEAIAAMERARKKAKLVLPAPQVAERELEEISRISAMVAGTGAGADLGNDGRTPAPALLAKGQHGGATPFLAPNTPARQPTTQKDTIMQEAQNLLRMTVADTPLVGGENPQLHPSDFSGVTPKRMREQYRTPNPLLAAAAAAAAATGGNSSVLVGATPLPVSDEMRINKAAAVERARKAAQKRDFEALLNNLPAPKYKYKISAPPTSKKEDENEDDDEDDDEMVDADDMTEKAGMKEKARKSAEKALLACCSSGMKRGLPRILHAQGIPALFEYDEADEERALAERLIGAELRSTVEFELHHFDPDSDRVNVEPFVNAKTGASTQRHTDLTVSEQRAAEALVEKELAASAQKQIPKEWNEAWDSAFLHASFVPSDDGQGGSWQSQDSLSKSEQKKCHANSVAVLKKLVERQRSANDKQASRLSLYLGGYEKRVAQQSELLDSAFKRLEQAQLELSCFTVLREAELRAIPVRLSDARSQLSAQESIERDLQNRYAALTTQP